MITAKPIQGHYLMIEIDTIQKSLNLEIDFELSSPRDPYEKLGFNKAKILYPSAEHYITQFPSEHYKKFKEKVTGKGNEVFKYYLNGYMKLDDPQRFCCIGFQVINDDMTLYEEHSFRELLG